MPELLIGDDIEGDALVEPLPSWRGVAQPIHALTPTHRRRSAKARAFVEHLHAILRFNPLINKSRGHRMSALPLKSITTP